MNVFAGEIVGILAHIERADENGAGGFEPFDERCVATGRRRVAVDLRAGERWYAGDIEQIFHRERHAGEWQSLFAARARIVERLRAQKGALLQDGGEGIKQRIALADARERCLQDVHRAGAAGGKCSGNIAGRFPGEVERGSFKHETPARARSRLEA
jgi:hypothetical protein